MTLTRENIYSRIQEKYNCQTVIVGELKETDK